MFVHVYFTPSVIQCTCYGTCIAQCRPTPCVCVQASVLAQPLAHPPGYSYVYSDLSMITMMYVLGEWREDISTMQKQCLISVNCDGMKFTRW